MLYGSKEFRYLLSPDYRKRERSGCTDDVGRHRWRDRALLPGMTSRNPPGGSAIGAIVR